jgi:hypothetical protein
LAGQLKTGRIDGRKEPLAEFNSRLLAEINELLQQIEARSWPQRR